MKKFSIGEIAGATGLITLLGIGLSVVYERSFMRIIGVDSDVFSLNPADYTQSIAVWLPQFLVAILAAFMLEAFFTAVEQGKSEDEILATSKNPKRLKLFRDLPELLFPVIVTLALVTNFIIPGPKEPARSMLYFMSWIGVGGFLLTRRGVIHKFPRILVISIYIGVACVLSVAATASRNACAILGKAKGDLIILTNGSEISGKILRRYSAFTIFIPDSSGEREIIENSEIKKIKTANHALQPTTMLVTPRAAHEPRQAWSRLI